MTDLAHREAEFLLCQTDDGRTHVEVRFDGETAWLSLGQTADDAMRPTRLAIKKAGKK